MEGNALRPETHCIHRGPRSPADWANALRYYQKLSELGLAPEVLVSDHERIKSRWYQPLPCWRGKHSDAEWKDMGLKVLALVTELHHHGVCHRDLHVGNFVVRDGEPLLIDMEFAVAADPAGPCYDLMGPGPSDIPVPDRHAVQPNANQNGVWWDADNNEVETCGQAFGSVAELQRTLDR